jgi:hypothetical protein
MAPSHFSIQPIPTHASATICLTDRIDPSSLNHDASSLKEEKVAVTDVDNSRLDSNAYSLEVIVTVCFLLSSRFLVLSRAIVLPR